MACISGLKGTGYRNLRLEALVIFDDVYQVSDMLNIYNAMMGFWLEEEK